MWHHSPSLLFWLFVWLVFMSWVINEIVRLLKQPLGKGKRISTRDKYRLGGPVDVDKFASPDSNPTSPAVSEDSLPGSEQVALEALQQQLQREGFIAEIESNLTPPTEVGHLRGLELCF